MIAAKIQDMVPDLKVAYAHGKMSSRELENIMEDFVAGDIDVLVSTTIIETGMDISNVNTIIVHDADRFGLSQLYQLRGRVGRSDRTAYAFLMYRKDKILAEIAENRLKAIREFSDLGSGIASLCAIWRSVVQAMCLVQNNPVIWRLSDMSCTANCLTRLYPS